MARLCGPPPERPQKAACFHPVHAQVPFHRPSPTTSPLLPIGFSPSSTRPGLREAPSACAAITHNIDNIDAMSSCATGRQGEPSPAKAKAFINITILICKRRPAVVGEGRKKNKRVEASSWSSSQCRRYPNVGS